MSVLLCLSVCLSVSADKWRKVADEWRNVEFKLIGMATVFKRDKIWWANIKAWDDKAQKYRWVKRSTKLTNKDRALAVAALLEEASQEQKNKGLKRHDAEQLVNDILRMAGGEGVSKCEPVGKFVQQFIDFKKRTVKTKTCLLYTSPSPRA